jgi:hypothetical protein
MGRRADPAAGVQANAKYVTTTVIGNIIDQYYILYYFIIILLSCVASLCGGGGAAGVAGASAGLRHLIKMAVGYSSGTIN